MGYFFVILKLQHNLKRGIFMDKLAVYIGNKIRSLRLENKLTQDELAEQLGTTKQTVSRYERGIFKVKQEVLYQLSDIFGISINDFFPVEEPSDVIEEITLISSKLPTKRQQNVLNYAKEQLKERNYETHHIINETASLYAVNTIEHLAAGVGFAYGDNEVTRYYTDRNDLKRYDVASVVKGDSMLPKFKDGDVVLIKNGYDNENGGIYAVDYDGKSFLKKVFFEGNRIRLVSTNDAYEDIYIYLPVEDNTYLNIIGKVVDSFTPIDK